MEIKIESLVSYEKIKKQTDAVFKLVDRNDTVVVLKNNQPAYLILKYEAGITTAEKNIVISESATIEEKVPKKRGRKPKDEAAQKTKTAAKKTEDKKPRMKLQEAMQLVLAETEDQQLHAGELAEAVYQRGLYTKRDGSKAPANQLRSSCNNYKDLFEVLPGNIIKLKTSDQ